MEEEWKVCIERYEISNKGNIRRKLLGGSYNTIKGSINNRGYKYFQLERDSKRINFLVHQEIARLFIGERPEGLVIDHIDRNKLNNEVSNLRYITQRENTFNADRVHSHISQDTPNRRAILSREYNNKNRTNILEQKRKYYQQNKDSILEKQKKVRHTVVCSKCKSQRNISHAQYNLCKKNGLENNICKRCSSLNNLGIKS